MAQVLRSRRPTAVAPRSRLELAMLDAAGEPVGGFTMTAIWKGRGASEWDVELVVTAEADRECGLRVAFQLDGPLTRWMVPAAVYSEPSLDAPAASRSLRSDRASHPVVMAWTGREMAALATDPDSPLGQPGLGFAAGGGSIWVDFPYREEPYAETGHGAAPPEVTVHRWRRGDTARVGVRLRLGPPDPAGYDAVLRALYADLAPRSPLRPWVSLDEAAELAAHGLLRWHYRPATLTLAEAVAFERGWDAEAPAPGDREDMHAAWLSGVPVAAALLEHGRATGDRSAVSAGEAVLDHVATALAPCGTFWGRWTPGAGWRSGWTPPDRLHARTAAEATLWLGRAVGAEARRGRPRPSWAAAVASSLGLALRTQGADGAFAATFDAHTGDGIDRRGTAGLLWIAALAEAGELGPAVRGGEHYASAVEQGALSGSPEDVPLGVSSEDGYNAVVAYTALHRATADRRWLETARLAANWTFTFRWAHNAAWPEHTLLDRYDVRTRGADAASPANPHLHGYGLVCVAELAELARLTGDGHLLERARDHLACFRQLLARADGDFNARRGMASERWYHTDSFGPKGGLLPVSHAWCLGLLLAACTAARSFPELDLPPA